MQSMQPIAPMQPNSPPDFPETGLLVINTIKLSLQTPEECKTLTPRSVQSRSTQQSRRFGAQRNGSFQVGSPPKSPTHLGSPKHPTLAQEEIDERMKNITVLSKISPNKKEKEVKW